MSELFGWIGSVCLALCGAPQALKCMRQGHARGLSPSYLSLWLTGEVCYVMAVLIEFGWVTWMMTNYILNIVWALIILWYKFRSAKGIK